MKRLVWLLIAVFCTALAQVQPVDVPVTEPAACDCCETAGDCGMPGCLPPLAAAPGLPALAVSAPAAIRLESKRLAPNPRLYRDRFHRLFVSAPVRAVPMLRPATAAAPAARVPLFKAQCSFLI